MTSVLLVASIVSDNNFPRQARDKPTSQIVLAEFVQAASVDPQQNPSSQSFAENPSGTGRMILDNRNIIDQNSRTILTPTQGVNKEFSDGYIVKLKEKPLFVKKTELIKGNSSITTSQLTRDINQQKSRITTQKNQFKGKITSIKTAKIKKEFQNVFNGFHLNASKADIEKIKNLPEVAAVYPNYRVNAALMDSVPLINANDVWAMNDNQGQNITGKGVTIAIIDTGVDYTHPDLGGCFGVGCKVIGGHDFVTCEAADGNGNCISPRPEDNNPADDVGHGTHVAAIAAGKGILKGVAPDANILAVKVLNAQGWGYYSWIISGIDYTVNPDGNPITDDGADIISMSVGGPGNPDDPASEAIDNAVTSGVVAVVTAGNSGPNENTIWSPGTARKAITVGAVDKTLNIVSFSSRGPVLWFNGSSSLSLDKPDIVAPGVNICAARWNVFAAGQTCLDNIHVSISGTSMATPHVAGVAALLIQAHPNWNAEEIKTAIKNGATDLGYSPLTQGAGFVNALNSISLIPPCNNFGDVDLDGFVTENDSDLVFQYDMGLAVLSQEQIIRADVDGDGNVTVTDGNLILQYAQGLRDTFPICPSEDSDSDGMPDTYELAHSCLNLTLNDSNIDSDNDALNSNVATIILNNIDEFNLGTDPCNADSDGDGFKDAAELYIGTNPMKSCGTDGWPLDIINGSSPFTTDVNIMDITSFLVPVRRFGATIGGSNYSARWDIVPGKGMFTSDINIQDITSFIAGPTAYPPMLNGQRAFNLNCPVSGSGNGTSGIVNQIVNQTQVKQAEGFLSTFGTPTKDSDYDGFPDYIEYYLGTSPLISCGKDWPPNTYNFGSSTNKVNLQDLNNFVSPTRYLGTKTVDKNFNPRYDLNFDGSINQTDINIVKKYMNKVCK